MRYISGALLFSVCIGLFTSCATLIYGTKSPIYISSTPKEIPVYVNDKYTGETPMVLNQPYSFSKKIVTLKLSESDKDQFNFIVEKKFRPISLIGAPLIIPFAVDLVTGSAFAHNSYSVYYNFNDQNNNSAWPFQIEIKSKAIKIDPLNFAENGTEKRGILKSNFKTFPEYEEKFGYALTGVYESSDPEFVLNYAELNSKEYKKIAATEVKSYTAYSNNFHSFGDLLPGNQLIPISFKKIEVSKIDRLEKSGKNEKKDIPKKSNKVKLLPKLEQFWPVLTSMGDKQVLFQAYPINQNSEFSYNLKEEFFSLDYLFVFVLADKNQAIELSPGELMQNISLFTTNPYLIELCKNSKTDLDLQKALNKENHHLSNILAFEWAQKSGTPFFETLPGKQKTTKEKEVKPRKGDPGIVADNNRAAEENKENLDKYSSKIQSTDAEQRSEADKYYGPGAPWYLRGMLKPEYRESAKELGLKEEEIYNPNKAPIDSTKWLREQGFELVPPDVSKFKPGIDPGYIDPNDPRKKPHETEGTPWYLQKPDKKKNQPNSPSPKGKS
ncbi:hypothetical protein [Luteibaculum oceani]|uniref:PEGA domain-containing protein n=1 Tax=Luteibaculum oceani TaxID=1294296 RepID=A0A5C6V0Y8_9FLAO|nr:hypothetical protein [Luteibaculum oceani]TXC78530.1 hypothetical protein FRX97_07365 [Luteibaculum oceani]